MKKDYIIGYLIGDLTWVRMPVLDIHWIRSNNVIKISVEDRLEYERVYKEQPFEISIKLLKSLENKYLPKEYKFYSKFILKDTKELRRGIYASLWDTDGCTYNLDTFKIETTEYKTIITFFLDEE